MQKLEESFVACIKRIGVHTAQATARDPFFIYMDFQISRLTASSNPGDGFSGIERHAALHGALWEKPTGLRIVAGFVGPRRSPPARMDRRGAYRHRCVGRPFTEATTDAQCCRAVHGNAADRRHDLSVLSLVSVPSEARRRENRLQWRPM
ncbi:TPA: hypothetical protein QDB44_004782 [Burkholderia vietnamiensis]|nr:hypothetical protein [Burkholderia vietnamiensis]